MDKFRKNFQKSFTEGSYRLLSLASITVNKVARPTAQRAYIFVQDRIPLEEDKNSPDYVNSFKRNFKEGMELGHSLAMSPLERIGDYLDQSVKEAESRLRDEYGVNTDQWLFSMENIEMLEKIGGLADLTFKEVRHVNRSNSIRYLNAWAVLQRLYLASVEKDMEKYSAELDYPKDHPKLYEYRQLQQECLYYSTFANGTYGKILNHLYSERRPTTRLVKSTNYTEDFVFHTKIADSDVIHSFWDTTPYRPAHVIAKDQFNKEIILCMRGTHHWGDAVTDLDFHYLNFSIMKEPNSDKFFLKFHYNEESQGYLKKRLGDDTRELNGEKAQSLTGNEIVIETGYAHAGMLVSAIGAYKEITPKLEDIFSKPDHSNYNLAITGHSLGGGMATLMTMLYLVHPLQAMKEKIDEKLRGYSYGGASVLSQEFDKYMRHTMKNVVLGYDIVPRLSYGSINDLCKIVLAFDEINAKDPNILSEVLKLNQDPNAFEKSVQSPESEQFTSLYRKFKQEHMNSLKLYPMGRIFHIQDFKLRPLKRDKRFYQYAMREINQKEYFDEIIFSRQLVKHHFPYLYEEGLSANKIIYQRYLDKFANKSSSAATPSEVKPYTH